MDEMKLTGEDIEMILESLKYSKKRFEEYEGYPSVQFKNERIESVNKVINKIKTLSSGKT
jgi:hypothetical protein